MPSIKPSEGRVAVQPLDPPSDGMSAGDMPGEHERKAVLALVVAVGAKAGATKAKDLVFLQHHALAWGTKIDDDTYVVWATDIVGTAAEK